MQPLENQCHQQPVTGHKIKGRIPWFMESCKQVVFSDESSFELIKEKILLKDLNLKSIAIVLL